MPSLAQLAALERYAQTPKGRASRKRAQANYRAKRRAQRQAANAGRIAHVDPQPLEHALANWR